MSSVMYTYKSELEEIIGNISLEEFENIKNTMIDAITHGNKIFLLGDGIHSAIADHFAVDLIKNVGNALGNHGLSIKTIAMNQAMPLLTALANDVSQDMVYAEILRLLANPGDLLLVISNGLQSDSVLHARKFAYEHGIKIASISGENTNPIKNYGDIYLNIATQNEFLIQDIMLFITHALTAALMTEIKYPVIFLDRDGVINIDSKDYIKSIEEFHLIDGAAEAIKLLNQNGYAVVVVTNQSIIGRGMVKEEDVEKIHKYMKKKLFERGAMINKIFYCPHSPADNCTCRKPSSQLIEKAFDELPLNREKAYMIGDRISDINAGLNAGINTIFISKQIEVDHNMQENISYHATDLFDAVTWLLKQK